MTYVLRVGVVLTVELLEADTSCVSLQDEVNNRVSADGKCTVSYRCSNCPRHKLREAVCDYF